MTITDKQAEYDYTHGEEPGLSNADVLAAWIIAVVGVMLALASI